MLRPKDNFGRLSVGLVVERLNVCPIGYSRSPMPLSANTRILRTAIGTVMFIIIIPREASRSQTLASGICPVAMIRLLRSAIGTVIIPTREASVH